MNNERLFEISQTQEWKTIKSILEDELVKVCDVRTLNSESELKGAQFALTVLDKIIRKIDGAKDALEIGRPH